MRLYNQVIVSNRLPISAVRSESGAIEFVSSSGGLATAMSSLEDTDQTWVGWCGIPSDDLTKAEKAQITEKFAEGGCVPVFLAAREIELYYEGYSNDTIWPLFHYFQSLARYRDEYWKAYEKVNKAFLKTILQVTDPKARVWIHDYHLMLLPQLVRVKLPAATVGFFLHIPFPSFEIFRLLPQRKEILAGLLGANIVGFHTYDYGRHFISSCVRLLGATASGRAIDHNGITTQIATYPIGVDYDKFRAQLSAPETKKALAGLDASYKHQKLILSVDRLDYSKGIPERLEAFRLLLEEHPQYRGKVTLLMIAVPSRTEVDAYRSLRDEIEKTVSRINGTYGTVNWAPISYQFQNRPFAEVVALYARADVMLVTPIRDGMNLVAKEYVAAKKRRAGVLILSEMAGAIDELAEAITINPNDSRSIMEAIRRGIEMPVAKQNERLKHMQKRIKNATVQQWASTVIDDLKKVSQDHARGQKFLTALHASQLRAQYARAQQKLIILDYDGTLKNHLRTPSILAATPGFRILRILHQLTEQPNTTVVIVSGRPRAALRRWFFGLQNIKLVAEHGAWTRYDRRWKHIHTDFAKYKKPIRKKMEHYTERTKGAETEDKDYATVWHYVNVEPAVAYKRANELAHELHTLLRDSPVSVHQGKDIIEVKPSMASKGRTVQDIIRMFPADFVLCAGDDYTDEDMFKALNDNAAAPITTIKVGSGDTYAQYRVTDTNAMLDLLESFLPTSGLYGLPPQIKKLPRQLPKKLSTVLSNIVRGRN